MRPLLSDEAEPPPPTNDIDALDVRVAADDLGDLALQLGHGVERDVLRRFGE